MFEKLKSFRLYIIFVVIYITALYLDTTLNIPGPLEHKSSLAFFHVKALATALFPFLFALILAGIYRLVKKRKMSLFWLVVVIFGIFQLFINAHLATFHKYYFTETVYEEVDTLPLDEESIRDKN